MQSDMTDVERLRMYARENREQADRLRPRFPNIAASYDRTAEEYEATAECLDNGPSIASD